MAQPPAELLEYLHRYPPPIQSLALGARKLIHGELAPCHEYIFDMRRTLVIAYSATEKVIADGVCLITVWTRHVTLAFSRGIDLDDPAGLLEGAGKAMRHVRLHALEDLGRRELHALLRQARTRAGIKRRRGIPNDVVTRVKKKSAATFPWPRLP
ncbi:MAG TPA: DUF1801 domain-containing protein [Vicinamibacterales bacterium]|nr:DUF1801 domain-containing protein [Vicinamibacterales bacterium]